MPVSFYRSARFLSADRPGLSLLTMLAGLALLAGWLTWSVRARVSRYEVTDSARLEVDRAAYPVQARVAGRIFASHATLGQLVRAGDILVDLESDSEKLSLGEEITRLKSVDPQLEALRAQTGVLDQGRHEERNVLNVAQEEARAKYREAEAQWKQAEVDAERERLLFNEKLIAESEYLKSRADAQSKRAAADSLQLAVSRLDPELRVRETDRDARNRQILTDTTKLDAQRATSLATIRRLEYEIERKRIRAPISGRLAEFAVLRPGGYVEEGDKLGVILPEGKLRIVADFAPAALGRLRPGQPAKLRLNGFPWAQYGSIGATVDRVAGEIRDGRVRVELALDSNSSSRIPLQHGLPGMVEVEVERVSPAALVLRSTGQALAAH